MSTLQALKDTLEGEFGSFLQAARTIEDKQVSGIGTEFSEVFKVVSKVYRLLEPIKKYLEANRISNTVKSRDYLGSKDIKKLLEIKEILNALPFPKADTGAAEAEDGQHNFAFNADPYVGIAQSLVDVFDDW